MIKSITPHILGLLLALGLLAVPNNTQAGSVTLADLETVLQSNPQFASLLLDLNLEAHGIGTRLGRHFGALSGARVGPYTFQGSLKSAPAEVEPIEIVLHTVWYIEDEIGTRWADEATPAEGEAVVGDLSIRERLVRVELRGSEVGIE